MRTVDKLLSIGVLLLLLVILFELVYYNHFTQKIQGTALSKAKSNEGSSATSYPTPTTIIEIEVQKGLKKFYEMVEKDIIISSIKNTKYNTEILEVNTNGGIYPISNTRYAVMLKIKVGDSFSYIPYNEHGLNRMTVVELVKGKETLIKFEDLQAGDHILIEEVKDLTKHWDTAILEIKITKT